MQSPEHFLWQEKYRPTKLEDYINSNPELAHKAPIWIEEKQIPHILLTGPVGTGKTTLAWILAKAVTEDQSDILYINASKSNNIDTIRNDISNFAYTSSIGGGLKVIILDEADGMTPQAQNSLRALMEEVTMYTRFILTGNYEHRFTEAMKSRPEHYRVNEPDEYQLLVRCVNILDAEKITFDSDTLATIISVCGKDIRKVIQELQRRSRTGTLELPKDVEKAEANYKYDLLDLVVNGNWAAARKLVCSQVQGDEWEDLYRFMYDNISKHHKFDESTDEYGEAIVAIAEHLYRHAYVADPEINCAALFIKLGAI